MELHQIRYFLALSETLNFTRAAQQCDVAQTSLTRAIKKLEQELGGDLFRRVRSRTHLTELGRHMLPIMQQTLNSAHSIESLAETFQNADRAPLCLALSHTINSSLFASYLAEIARALPGLEVRIMRGSAGEVADQDAVPLLDGPECVARANQKAAISARNRNATRIADRLHATDSTEKRRESSINAAPAERPSQCGSCININLNDLASLQHRHQCTQRKLNFYSYICHFCAG